MKRGPFRYTPPRRGLLYRASLGARGDWLGLRPIRNWEHDHRSPGAEAILKLARALGVSMEELVEHG